MSTDTMQYNLEELIDGFGLPSVIGALIDTCHLKAEHVRENWGDEGLARQWEKRAAVLDSARERCRNITVD